MPDGAITPLRDAVAHPHRRRTYAENYPPRVVRQAGKNLDQAGVKNITRPLTSISAPTT